MDEEVADKNIVYSPVLSDLDQWHPSRGVPVAALAHTYYTMNSFAHTLDHSSKLKAPRLQKPSPQGLPTTQNTIWDYFGLGINLNSCLTKKKSVH